MLEQPKPKRGAPSDDDDDVIDLDALVRSYGRDDAPSHYTEYLDDDHDAPSKPKRKNDQLNRNAVIQPPRDSLQVSYNLAHVPDYVEENPEHRKQAAIAHLMVVIGILISFASLGALLPLALIISRQIYAQNRSRSPFLAHHSLQAVVVLTGATLGWLGLTAATFIAVFFALMFPVLIVVALMMPLLWLLSTAVTIGTFFYGFVGISQALKGKTFRYPLSLFSFGVETHDFFPSVLRPDKMFR
jgi:uncharacterized Tic20 family protein